MDNVSIPFRVFHTETIGERVDAIRTLGLLMRRVDPTHETTFVYVNHLTTRFLEAERSFLVPALGENWAVMCDMEIMIEERREGRAMLLMRSDLIDCLGRKELLFRINVCSCE